MEKYIIKTSRLGLRNWQDSDIENATMMNADMAVMEFFPNIWSRQETEKFIKRMQTHFSEHGFCYFAVDELNTGNFIGFTGLLHQTYQTNFTPFIDIGWRLMPNAWGKGFATEGANACLNYAFHTLNLPTIFAIAPELNLKSQKVMQKIGMTEYAHFIHPKIDPGNPLKKCVAYRILKKWL